MNDLSKQKTGSYLGSVSSGNQKLMTDDRIRTALSIVAKLISAGEHSLWPLFDKLETELDLLESRKLRLASYEA